MTRISNKKLGALAGGLLAMAAAGAGIAQETAADRYARTLAEADITARYNVQLEQQLGSQAQEIAALEEQVAGLDTTAVDVQSLLQRMFDELVQFVENDVPFFKEERDQRIAAAHRSHGERRGVAVGEVPPAHRGVSDRDGVWPDDELLTAKRWPTAARPRWYASAA